MAPVPGISTAQTIAFLVIASFYGSFLFISTIIYFVQGRRDQHLSKRSLWLTSLGGISNAFLSTSFLMAFGFYDSYPCVMDYLADYLGVVPLCLTIIGRAIRLVFIAKLQLSFAPSNARSTSPIGQSPLGSAEITTIPTHSTMFHFFPSSQAVLERRLAASLGIILFIDLVYTAFTLLYTRTVDSGTSNPPPPSIGVFPVISYSCTGAPGFLPFYVIIACYFILCPMVLFYGWNLRDAYGIRKSLVYSICIGIPCFIIYLVWAFYFEERYGRYFSALLWPMPAFFAIHWTSVIVPLRNYRRKKGFGRTPDSSEFERVLASPIEFSQFCRHSVEHFVAEHTRFLEDYQILKVKTIESFIGVTPSYGDLSPARAEPAMPAPLHVPQHKRSRSRSPTTPTSPTAAPLLSSRWPHQLSRNTSSIDIYTVPPPTISMLQSVLLYLPPGSSPNVVPVPEELKSQYQHFYMTFIRPGGILETNLTNAVWCKVAQAVEQDEMHVDMFEEAKREVLDLLFFNIFPTFMEKHENELWRPTVTMQGPRSSGQSSRVGLSSWGGRPTAAEMIVLELI